MKIGIAGTNKFNNYQLFCSIINKIIKKTYSKNIEIVILDNSNQENNYMGIPLMAAKFANQFRYNFTNIKLDFYDYTHKLSKKKEKNGRTYNSNAGLIQNTNFLESCDFFIIFHRNEKNIEYLIKLADQKKIIFYNFDLSKEKTQSFFLD